MNKFITAFTTFMAVSMMASVNADEAEKVTLPIKRPFGLATLKLRTNLDFTQEKTVRIEDGKIWINHRELDRVITITKFEYLRSIFHAPDTQPTALTSCPAGTFDYTVILNTGTRKTTGCLGDSLHVQLETAYRALASLPTEVVTGQASKGK